MELPTYVVHLDNPGPGLLSLFITVVLPLLVGLLTKFEWSTSVKAVCLIVLASVKTVVEAAIFSAEQGVPFQIYPVLLTAVANLVAAIAIHFGVWKPTPIGQAAARAGVK